MVLLVALLALPVGWPDVVSQPGETEAALEHEPAHDAACSTQLDDRGLPDAALAAEEQRRVVGKTVILYIEQVHSSDLRSIATLEEVELVASC